MGEIGNNIKCELNRQKMTQKELCELTGIKESVMSKYINENESIRSDVLIKIADALHVNVYQLLGIPYEGESAYEICKRALTARGGNNLTESESRELIKLILGD